VHVGLYPLLRDDRRRLLECDFDGPTWPLDAGAYIDAAQAAGVPAALERSRSGEGAHVCMFFSGSVAASAARRVGAFLLREAMTVRAEIDLTSDDRLFPAQDFMPNGSFGNLIALPLQGACRRRGTSVFLDPSTLRPFDDQWALLSAGTAYSARGVRRTELSASAYSARWIAAVRARESARPDHLFEDPWAGLLAGDAGRLSMAASERASGGRSDFIPIRTRFFEDLIRDQAPLMDQVVLLGAGLDTRAFRLTLPASLDWFEIDEAALLHDKETVLAAAGASPGCRRHPVAVDLAGEWEPELLAVGFRPGRRTLWIAEGLFFYLTESTVVRLVGATVRLSGAGSAIAADASGSGLLRAPGMARYLESRAARGDPAPFFTDDPRSLLQSSGWRDVELVEPGHLAVRYGRPMAPGPAQASADALADPTMRSHFFIGRL
jgi:methyltransferase (TIGR00027 family)